MVAITMYRGNLHRVPDVPRRWDIPPQPIPLRRFKSLLSRRSSSLSRLNPNPSPSIPVKQEPPEDAQPPPPPPRSDGGGAPLGSGEVAPAGSHGGDGAVENVKMEVMNTENAERRKELQKKLSILNEKKHYLVQMLKQILNAEEEMKRRIMMQSGASRSSLPFPAEASFDQGAAGRHVAPRLSVDVSTGIDPGGESELNQHSQGHLQQMPCASPSASLGRPLLGSFQRNSAFQSPRASLSGVGNAQTISNMFAGGTSVTASPRLPSSQQGTSADAVSGTHF